MMKNKIKSKKHMKLEKTGENRGRKKQNLPKEKIASIMEEVENEMKSDKYTKIINLNEENESITIFNKIDDLPDLPINKEIKKMTMNYINGIRNTNNNEKQNEKIKLKLDIINSSHFIKNLNKIISHLNMNENELAIFTIILDKVEWKSDKKFDQWEHFYNLGILTLQKIFNRFQDFQNEKYISWKENIKKDINDDIFNGIGLREMNSRNKELRNQREYSYIDYNEIVDTIIDNAHLYKKRKKE